MTDTIFENISIESDDPLFIRTLKWAAMRGAKGFKVGELKSAVAKTEEEWVWVSRMMLGEINGEPVLLYHAGSHHKGGEFDYFLTASGASILMDYLELKEARESSKQAKYIAIASLVLAVVMSFAQILIQIFGFKI